jgi:hypothetical protein
MDVGAAVITKIENKIGTGEFLPLGHPANTTQQDEKVTKLGKCWDGTKTRS